MPFCEDTAVSDTNYFEVFGTNSSEEKSTSRRKQWIVIPDSDQYTLFPKVFHYRSYIRCRKKRQLVHLWTWRMLLEELAAWKKFGLYKIGMDSRYPNIVTYMLLTQIKLKLRRIWKFRISNHFFIMFSKLLFSKFSNFLACREKNHTGRN